MIKTKFIKIWNIFFVTLALLALISVPIETVLLIFTLTGVLKLSWILLIPVGIIAIFVVVLMVDIMMLLDEYWGSF